MKNKLYYGAAYYPELWEDNVIECDIRLMKEAGINVVRMGEFAWSTMEPHMNKFHVEYFINVIDRLYKNGIETIMCTPTATPPIWVSYNHPERMLKDENLVEMSHGGRQQVCTNNGFLRHRAALIVEKMAEIYGSNPGVIGWQIDNELKGNVSECYCGNCKKLWHKWLENKYGSIEKLNKAWGTHIWSQHYECFEQVPQPLKTPAGQNPSLTTAYRMFSRELTADFVKEQVREIRKHSKLPITHNSSLNHFIDNEKVFEVLDFVSFDHYSKSSDYNQMLTYMDTFKTLKSGSPFWVMETSPSFCANGYGYQTVHNNGYLKVEAAAAYANGAGGFCYWLWRQQRSGFEQTHGSIINSWGMPSVGFENVVEAGKFIKLLEKALLDTVPVQAEIAVSYSDRARAFFMTENLEGFCANYVEVMMKLHQMVLDIGMQSDFIFEKREFEGFKLLLTPFMPYVSDEYISRAKQFVENGGIWIVGPVTGMRTGEHTVNTDYALGKLEDAAGVRTVYHYPMTGSGAYGEAFGMKAELILWSSVFECREAEVIGKTEGGATPDMPFITECKRGKGKIIMLGSMPAGEAGEEMLKKLIFYYAKESGVNLPPEMSRGTIGILRRGETYMQWIVLNMDGKGGKVNFPISCKDALTGAHFEAGEDILLESYDCKVIEYHKSS